MSRCCALRLSSASPLSFFPSLSHPLGVTDSSSMDRMDSPTELRCSSVVNLDEPRHREWSRRPGSTSLDLIAGSSTAVMLGCSRYIEQSMSSEMVETIYILESMQSKGCPAASGSSSTPSSSATSTSASHGSSTPPRRPQPRDADGAALQHLNVDLLLITQSLDDHCHLRTLTKLAAIRPNLPVVTTPNARPILSALPFTDVTYLEPGQSTTAGEVTVLATAGPVLGPPWQRPENGYIVTTAAAGKSVYYEPHCVYDAGFLRDRALRADVLITPVIKQLLPADFTLVSGQEDAVELAGLLNPSYVVPMSNGEFDAKGLLAALVSTRGTIQAFRAMLADALPDAKVVEPTPGVPLHLCFDDDHDNNNNTNSSSSS
ncbi:hypothetical protein ZWY2020_046756 [Hordeum vulgare]|nr:hypothetical protein ZWY2020_046756 [Hordeum vulgare]